MSKPVGGWCKIGLERALSSLVILFCLYSRFDLVSFGFVSFRLGARSAGSSDREAPNNLALTRVRVCMQTHTHTLAENASDSLETWPSLESIRANALAMKLGAEQSERKLLRLPSPSIDTLALASGLFEPLAGRVCECRARLCAYARLALNSPTRAVREPLALAFAYQRIIVVIGVERCASLRRPLEL